MHKIVGADEPQGWDTQIENELVFRFSRERLWRSWVSQSGNVDFLTHGEIGVGIIQSGIGGSAMIRYGRQLLSSYATPLLHSDRISNPAALDGGWYVYAGLQVGYIFNQISTDGNTFRDSRSIDYDREQLGITTGFAYSWQKISVTFAISDSNIINGSNDEALDDLTQFGTLTVGLQL